MFRRWGICIAEVSPHSPDHLFVLELTSAMGVTQPLTALCTQFKQQLSHLYFGLAYISSNGFFSQKNWNQNMQPACSNSLPLTSGKRIKQTPQCGMTSCMWSATLHSPASPFSSAPLLALPTVAATTLPCPSLGRTVFFLPSGSWTHCFFTGKLSLPSASSLALSLQSFLGLSFLKKGWGNSWKYSPNNQYTP